MENNWKTGTEMNDWIKERYYKICRSRYRTISGECFGFAGASILMGTSGAILSSRFRLFFIALFGVMTLVSLLSAFWIKRQMKKDLAFIPAGDFFWKYDEVRELLPDRYPQTCKIVAESEGDTCVILQGFWYFREKGTGVYLIKRDPKPEVSGMAARFCQMDADVQAIIA